MLIRHFIVTYNNTDVLHAGLDTLKPTIEKYDKSQYELFILNNHTNFHIDPYYDDKVKVIHNQGRPDFSTGHLTRNWNQAIIHGFEDLINPKCDIVIASQNDTAYTDDFLEQLIELHKTYDLVQFGAGDTFMSYTPNAIKKIGLWDERFCNIGYQEADYFLRAYLYLHDRTTINDIYHGRTLNQVTNRITKDIFQTGHLRGEQSHLDSIPYHTYQKQLYKYKWHSAIDLDEATSLYWHNIQSFKNLYPKIDSFIYYPYFEKGVDKSTLIEQRYIGCRNF